jgi:hypothetical protein
MRFRQFKMFELLSFHQQHLEQESRIKHDSETQESHKKLAGSVMKPKRRAKTRILRLKISLTVAQTHTTHTTHTTLTPLTPYPSTLV